MGVGKKVLNDVKPYMMMILLQVGYAGMYIVSVASLKRGMSHYVLVTYRNLVATLVMLPFALFFEKGTRPKMTLRIFIKILGLALLEPVLDQNLYYVGNKLTSASFSSALVNILPAVTFIMAIVLRMEKLRLRSTHSQAKVAGTICTVIGAVLMIMYHGPVVQFPWARGAHHVDQAASAAAAQSSSTWLKGTIAIITSCVAWAGFFVLQEETTLGSVIGAAIIVVGLYSLIWGKSNDIIDKPVHSVAEKLALPLTSVNGNGTNGTNGTNGGRHVNGGQVAHDVETPAVKGAICH
ncbi:hypothetical protein ACQJBY_070844 [Aegilops geniculata]